MFLFSYCFFTVFYSVCAPNFSKPPACVNVFLNKISVFFVAPFRIFAKCGRAAHIPDDFASFLGIFRLRMSSNRPAFPQIASTDWRKNVPATYLTQKRQLNRRWRGVRKIG